ncbi:MAG: SDR family NAD(P)-dependent oxidoreductase [Pseudomonadota bacterium]
MTEAVVDASASAETGARQNGAAPARRAILITGCSSGIGRAAAFTLRARGWRVFAACRKQADCDALIADGFESPRIDYQDEASILAGAEQVLQATDGKLYALFNNGAFASPGATEDLPTDCLREIFEANFFGWHTLTRAVIPAMRRNREGRIVQCSSVLGFATLKYRGAYQATKYALEGLTDTMRIEMHDSGIEVILIQPGPILTEIRRNSYSHFKKWITWEGSAHAHIYPKIEQRLTAESLKSKFELGPDAVVEKLIHALESSNPRPRYMVTFPTYLLFYLKKLLPNRALDRLLIKQSY